MSLKKITWPVPNSDSKQLPVSGEKGAFWDNINGYSNCGVKVFAPEDSDVLTITDGRVLSIERFSSNEMFSETWQVIIKTKNNLIFKYAGIKDITVRIGDSVNSGDKLGMIASILESDSTELIRNDAMFYRTFNETYLHLEILRAPFMEIMPYKLGYFINQYKPNALVDPSQYLNDRFIIQSNAA